MQWLICGKNIHSCHKLNIRKNMFGLSPLNIMLAMGFFSIDRLRQIEDVALYSLFVEGLFFNHEWMRFCQMLMLSLSKCLCNFLFFLLLI